MREENAKRLTHELAQKERELKKRLEKDYEERLKRKIKEREAQLEKQKEILEKHVVEQAKKLFH